MTIQKSIIYVVAAGLFAIVSNPVTAASVKLSGYDLERVEEVDRLHRAILSEVRQACGEQLRKNYYPAKLSRIRQCVKVAMEQTIDGSGIPMLSRFHASIDGNYRYDWQRAPMAGVMVASQ